MKPVPPGVRAAAQANYQAGYEAGLQEARAGGTLGWAGDPDGDRPMPEGLECFAHWSKVHGGINVELTVPEGLRLTVHVNDFLAVDTTIGDPIPEGWPAHREYGARREPS